MSRTAMFNSPPSLADEVVRVITERIVRGEIPPGSRLIEEKLSEEFGISRPPIRESLRTLASEGLITIHHRKGARVRTITAREVQEIYQCREALEGFAARLAAANATLRMLASLERTLGQMEAAEERGDLDAYFRHNIEFHESVGEASGNGTLRRQIRALGAQVLMMRHTSLSLPGRSRRSLELHNELTQAFRRRDSDEAQRLTGVIIREAAAALADHLAPHSEGRAEALAESPDHSQAPVK